MESIVNGDHPQRVPLVGTKPDFDRTAGPDGQTGPAENENDPERGALPPSTGLPRMYEVSWEESNPLGARAVGP